MNAGDWPSTEDDVTAECLAQYYAKVFQLNYGANTFEERFAPEKVERIVSMVYCYAATLLLRHVDDDVAKRLFREIEDGGDVAGESISRWLNQWGMDPDAITTEGARLAGESK